MQRKLLIIISHNCIGLENIFGLLPLNCKRKAFTGAKVTVQQKPLSHRRAGVQGLHGVGLLHLAGRVCLRLQGCERQGWFRGFAHGL